MYQYNDYELIYLISEQDELALDIMYKKYIPLIKARIAAFRIKEFNREDFFQEGLFMLHKAISTYRPDSGKTFNKYFDMILQRHYIQLLRKESKHFYNVVLTDELDYLKEEKEEAEEAPDLASLLSLCRFSPFEKKVLDLRLRNSSVKEITALLNCSVKQVYDANDRIRRKLQAAKISLDRKIQI